MIKLSVKGLAKYMTSGDHTRRRVLRDFKYPREDEPMAMRLYYQDACDRIEAFHRGRDRNWLRSEADDLARLAALTGGSRGARLRHNAQALRRYEEHFGDRSYVVQKAARLNVQYGDVVITVAPDLSVLCDGRPRLVKFDFGAEPPPERLVKIVTQVMFEAALPAIPDLKSGSVIYADVSRGVEHRGARMGAAVQRDIVAACQTIAQIWDGIAPPA